MWLFWVCQWTIVILEHLCFLTELIFTKLWIILYVEAMTIWAIVLLLFWLGLSPHLTHLLIRNRSLLIMEAACCFSVLFINGYFADKIKLHMIKATTNQQKNLMSNTIWLDIVVEFVALPGILLCCKFNIKLLATYWWNKDDNDDD